ncbi:MAG: PAS domain S-box protein [Methanomicrobiales archaeon]|nr:PAS domain S-box protein [Methanomicrobiales archaeon]NYT21780.1 PAS domain S-box protein [Methanomicrobiales archaeon]
MITILLVHDNSDLIDLTRSYLEKGGEVRVDAVSSTKQAIDVLKNRNYDVIVSYFQLPEVNGIEFLPEMNGVELLQYLKSHGNPTPFILYTRLGRDRILLEDLNSAGEVVFPKGVEPRTPLSELRDLIYQAVLRKKLERDQTLRTDLLSSILSLTPIWICQIRGGVMEWTNTPMSAGLGYDDGGLVGKNATALFADRESFERASRELTLSIDGNGWGRAETLLKKKDGSPVHCILKVHAIDSHDPARGQVMIIEDITEKKRLEEAVRESGIRTRELLMHAGSLIMKLDLAGTITFFNTYAQTFFGYSEQEVLGKNIVGTLIPSGETDGRDATGFASDVALNGEGVAIRISGMRIRDGSPVWVAWTTKAIRDAAGHVSEVVCIGHDITDRTSRERPRISTAMWKDRVIGGTDVEDGVFDAVFSICLEISREGREGKKVGTAFVIGDAENVLAKSRQLILNPFAGHQTADRMVTNHDIKENIKELAQLDGAFVIRGDGLIEAAARYITIDTSAVGIQKGLGTRHSSVAGITLVTNAIGIVVSQSGGKISIFRDGRIVQEIA